MAFTKTEKHLVIGLKLFGLTEENQRAIFLALQTEKQQRTLVDYMMEHLSASEQDILKETVRILKATEEPL